MRPVPGFDGYYVTNTGRVWSTRPWRKHPGGRWLTGGQHTRHTGHRSVMLAGTHHLVHAVVTRTFLGPRPDGLQVRHLDGDPTNNHLGNLAYGTQAENSQDSLRHGTNHFVNRTHCINGHEFTPENTYYRPKGEGRWRSCRECKRLTDIRLREKRKKDEA